VGKGSLAAGVVELGVARPRPSRGGSSRPNCGAGRHFSRCIIAMLLSHAGGFVRFAGYFACAGQVRGHGRKKSAGTHYPRVRPKMTSAQPRYLKPGSLGYAKEFDATAKPLQEPVL